jgi:Flp pilus assembly protein TadD
LYLLQDRFAEAATTTAKALELNDRDFVVWANLVAAYDGLKDQNKVAYALSRELPLLEQAANSNPRDSAVQYRLGDIYARQKQTQKALAHAQTALALSPEDPVVLVSVGGIYERLGDRRRAVMYVERALQKGYSLPILKADPLFESLLSDPNFRPASK